MGINFLAETMQGYNNPKIEIVNVELDINGALITQITFDDIAKILARGIFPILSVWSVFQGNKIRYTMPLSYARDDVIIFSSIVMVGTPNSPSGNGCTVKFNVSGPPVLLKMALNSGAQ